MSTPTPAAQYDNLVSDYDQWFVDNAAIVASEFNALHQVLPDFDNALEIGVGTGFFAKELGIQNGIDPSTKMLERARERGIRVEQASAEDLPYGDNTFDAVFFITVDGYVDLPTALAEAKRVPTPDGTLVIGMLDWDTPVGTERRASHADSPYFAGISFHSSADMVAALQTAGFTVENTRQTVFSWADDLSNPHDQQEVREGLGDGYFAVLTARIA